MSKEAVIIYYSSGREDQTLERKVQENILANRNGIPIISVTQFPTSFGEVNYVVGDVGTSGFNMFRQVQIACMKTGADFVISAETDCLYPPDYFTFRPESLMTCYRTSNLYVMPDKRAFFFHKAEGATHAQIVGREFYLNRLNELFKGAPQWSVDEKNFPKERHKLLDVFKEKEIEHYKGENPVVQIKTHKGMRYYTHSDRTPIHDLPYWGNGVEFRKKYYG